jgi:hypothetical protein
MDPVTAISIAQFAISTYGMLSSRGGGDPLDAIVGMLIEINNKLNVINDKLDIIYDAVVVLPDRIEYKRRTNDLISVANRMPVIFRNLNSDIEKYGEQRGRLEFKEKNKLELSGYLNVLRLSSGLLRTEIDPLTISLLASACQNDYELCRVLQVDPDYIKNEQLEYLTYFKRALWTDNNSLEKKIENSVSLMKAAIDEKFINEWRFLATNPNNGGTIQLRDHKIKLYSSTFSPLDISKSEKQVTNTLMSMGYFDLPYFNHQLTGYESKELSKIPNNNSIPVINTHRFADFYGGSFGSNNEHVFEKYKGTRLKENQIAFKINRVSLIACCSANITAHETVKHINNRIL